MGGAASTPRLATRLGDRKTLFPVDDPKQNLRLLSFLATCLEQCNAVTSIRSFLRDPSAHASFINFLVWSKSVVPNISIISCQEILSSLAELEGGEVEESPINAAKIEMPASKASLSSVFERFLCSPYFSGWLASIRGNIANYVVNRDLFPTGREIGRELRTRANAETGPINSMKINKLDHGLKMLKTIDSTYSETGVIGIWVSNEEDFDTCQPDTATNFSTKLSLLPTVPFVVRNCDEHDDYDSDIYGSSSVVTDGIPGKTIRNNKCDIDNYTSRILDSFDDVFYRRFIVNQTWIATFLVAAEALNCAISVGMLRSVQRSSNSRYNCSKHMNQLRGGSPLFPLVYVNSAFEGLFGYSRSEAVGLNMGFTQLRPHVSILDEGGVKLYRCPTAEDLNAHAGLRMLETWIANRVDINICTQNFTRNDKDAQVQYVGRPICNQMGQVILVVMLYFKVPTGNAAAAHLKNNCRLGMRLPSMVVTES